jgi:hypothetical protein
MQLLDLAPVPLQLSHVSKKETSISRCPPKTDSSKLKYRSYLQYKTLQIIKKDDFWPETRVGMRERENTCKPSQSNG